MILQPAGRGTEGVANGYVDIFVGVVLRAAPLHGDLLAGTVMSMRTSKSLPL